MTGGGRHFVSHWQIVSPYRHSSRIPQPLPDTVSDCVRHKLRQRRVPPSRSIRGRYVVWVETGADYHQPPG